MDFIHGEDREQTLLLPDCIEDYIDENNPIRIIDAYINGLDLSALGFFGAELKGTGRPPYNPKDLLKLYVYGYMNRIRSSRRLETESKRNLEVIWLLGKLSPDHKTISDFRRVNPAGLKKVFQDFVKLCVKLDLYGKELVAIDGSKFKAVNSKSRNFTKDKLEKRLKRLEEKIDEYLAKLDKTDEIEDGVEREKTASEINQIIKDLSERKEHYQEYSAELERTGETQKSLTDSESRLMPTNGKMDVCYNVQTAVDAKNKLIAEFEITNKTSDMNQLMPMAGMVQEILELKTIAVAADAGYDSASDIAAVIQAGAEPHIAGTDYDICVPVTEVEEPEITSHTKGRCVYLPNRNVAVCPMGKVLYPRFYKQSTGQAIYHNSAACKTCMCRCTTMKRGLCYELVKAEADFTLEHSDAGIMIRQVHIKPQKEIYKQRKSLSEHPFGTIKRSMDAGYCLVKGKRKVRGEFSLIFLAYNLKRVINIMGSRKLIESIGALARSV